MGSPLPIGLGLQSRTFPEERLFNLALVSLLAVKVRRGDGELVLPDLRGITNRVLSRGSPSAKSSGSPRPDSLRPPATACAASAKLAKIPGII
jgi:hypothetical protein